MSDETKCAKCGHDRTEHNGPRAECDRCMCVLFVATPPTPDPRERGEDEFTALPYWEKAKRLGLPGDMARALNAACDELFRLRATAPSEAVGWERQEAEWFRWLRDNPQSAAFIAVLVAKNRPHGPDLGASMNSGDVIGVMEDAKQPKYRYTNPAPARGVTVTEAMVDEMAKQAALGHTRFCVGVHENGEAEWIEWPEAFTRLLTPDAP